MKNIDKTLLILLMLLSVLSFAQEKEKKEVEEPKHEVRIIIENFLGDNNIEDNYGIYNQSNFSSAGTYEFYTKKFNYGLGYNLNFKNFGIRTKFFYTNYNEDYYGPRDELTTADANLFRVAVGGNYQKHFDKLLLFSGVDFGYFEIDLTQKRIVDFSTNNYTQAVEYKGYSFEPLVGFKYFLLDNFSISSEVRLIIDSYTGYSEITYRGNNLYQVDKNDFDGHSYQIGPSGSISLNVHF